MADEIAQDQQAASPAPQPTPVPTPEELQAALAASQKQLAGLAAQLKKADLYREQQCSREVHEVLRKHGCMIGVSKDGKVEIAAGH